MSKKASKAVTHAEDEIAPKVDGRRARSERTRGAIVDALLALVDEGDLQPTAQAIADRAGVALRSIRQHFLTRDELLMAGAAKHAGRIAESHAAVTSDGSLRKRLERFVEARVDYLEQTTGVRRAAALHAATSKIVASGARVLIRERRKEVARAFSRELEACDEERRDDLLEALHVFSSGSTWDALRRDSGRSRREATIVLSIGLDAMLRAARSSNS